MPKTTVHIRSNQSSPGLTLCGLVLHNVVAWIYDTVAMWATLSPGEKMCKQCLKEQA